MVWVRFVRWSFSLSVGAVEGGSVSGSCAWLSRLLVSSSVDLASGEIGRFCLFVSRTLHAKAATDIYILAITDSWAGQRSQYSDWLRA